MASTQRISRRKLKPLPADPYESAKIAGLRYVSPDQPGIVRKRSGRGFLYVRPNGEPVRELDDLKRIRSLVIPPAWTSVWICASPNGHLQAVGRDAKGRKQYRYHPLYRQVRDQTKFTRMVAFGEALPAIRARVAKDLGAPEMPKRKVLATVVRLLEETCIRIGNEEYAKDNDSYGLTTMHDDHVEVEGRKLRFHFRGKSGLFHDIEVSDPKVAKIVQACQCIPGHELFHYLDEAEQVTKIYSEDVNDYLREITGADFTAKDFRTWVGTNDAALTLEKIGGFSSETEAKRNIVEAIKSAAQRLGNKPSTCRKYYVHPAILDAYLEQTLFPAMERAKPPEQRHGLRREEVAVLAVVLAHSPAGLVDSSKAA